MKNGDDKVTTKMLKGGNSIRQINSKPKTRITLSTPYAFKWPKLAIHDEEHIRKLVKKTFEDGKVRKGPGKYPEIKKEPSAAWKYWNDLKKKRAKEIWAESKQLRGYLALGLSQVIRCLDKDQLCAVLLCRDVDPAVMLEPLLMLCSSRDVHAASISGLGLELQTALNFKSCRALGLKRSVAKATLNPFYPLLEVIREKAMPLPEELRKLNRPTATTSGGRGECDDEVSGDSSSNDESESDVEEKDGERVAVVESPNPLSKVAVCTKDYSYLYVKKVDVVATSIRTSGPCEDFISLSHIAPPDKTPGKTVSGSRFLSSNLTGHYKDVNVKRLQSSGKRSKKGKRKDFS